MAYDQFHKIDATSQMIEVALRSSSTGMLLTGVAHGGVTASYVREGAASQTTVSVVAGTQGTFVSGGWVETGIAGVYQFGIPDAALAAGAKAVTLVLSASGAIDVVKRVVLVVEDLRDVLVSSRLAPTDAGRTLDIAATGEASANVTMWKDATAPAMTGDAYARLGAPAGASVSADIAAIAAASAAGSGAISFPVTVNDEGGDPIDGVEVWISTDSAGASVVAGTLSTDALGLATFMLDAGTFYLWRQKSGYNFANPVTIVVS